MGFDIVPWEQIGDAESLHGICKRYHYPPPPLCHHRYWAPNLLALAATGGCCRGLSALVSLWESIDTVWRSSSFYADLGEGWRGCVAALHQRFSCYCKMTPLTEIPILTLVSQMLGIIWSLFLLVIVALYSPNSSLKSGNMLLQCSPRGRETFGFWTHEFRNASQTKQTFEHVMLRFRKL